ncbi:MAG: hypothetical protein JWO12_243 [Frankiales bacterium]|nr:hypothetical protein [Frankiales bacterium]
MLTTEEIEHLVMMATCAPSVHNTQPWTFTPTADGLLVQRDRTRQLGVIDPDGREMMLSCGAALHHLEVAARAIGVDAVVTVDVDDDRVATVRLTRGAPATEAEIARAVAILHRHTHRGRFDEEPVSDTDLDRIRLAVEVEHGRLRIVQDDELVAVEVAVSRAERSLADLAGYSEELAEWVWHGIPDENRGDGLPTGAIDHGSARGESLEGRAFDGATPRPSEPPVAEHPAVVLLLSAADTPRDWVQAGRALSALLLTATEAGLLAQPFGQVIDLPGSRQALGQVLGTVGAPQMLLRLGHGTSHPVTPRRPVADVLIS